MQWGPALDLQCLPRLDQRLLGGHFQAQRLENLRELVLFKGAVAAGVDGLESAREILV